MSQIVQIAISSINWYSQCAEVLVIFDNKALQAILILGRPDKDPRYHVLHSLAIHILIDWIEEIAWRLFIGRHKERWISHSTRLPSQSTSVEIVERIVENSMRVCISRTKKN